MTLRKLQSRYLGIANDDDDIAIPADAEVDPRLILPPRKVRMKEKVNATFVTLARNEELYGLLTSINHIEDRFNRKFHYDWVFFNDVPFSEEFIQMTSAVVSGKAFYEVIPKEHWSFPEWINPDEARASIEKMKNKNGRTESYRHMCRFESGFFWQQPIMDKYDWYWRVEPNIEIYCDINYDVFKYMQDNNKVYGFTIAFHEFRNTIPTLWKSTQEFLDHHPEYIAEDNLQAFVSDNNGKTYNTCHFWTNFEIASLDFWRSQAYREYFDFLDHKGGFFWERWGDAPIHSIAASLFLQKDKIHFFEDIGYKHTAYRKCPLELTYRASHHCACDPERDWTYRSPCGKKYFKAMGIPLPQAALDLLERDKKAKEAKNKAEKEAKEKEASEKEASEKAEKEAKENAEKEAKEKAE
ncbi:uncharacterized protein J8A68_004791 [[Candida] subhashii]|uniref:Glycolipid 2-alpha-mannosyltransferase n=1 Tax=[Candida] subhashii TaxID=561895 RepID=A0A8J5QJS6_9ASCO|nr:uncharacterized protein J8A68_004791 [[Candida] subhashii]KAG7661733.1 hypothetical protein J8A68_004791 [[Candida] subhashii]